MEMTLGYTCSAHPAVCTAALATLGIYKSGPDSAEYCSAAARR